jgi:hypothetical protein
LPSGEGWWSGLMRSGWSAMQVLAFGVTIRIP